MIENISIFYNKKLLTSHPSKKIDDLSILEVLQKLAGSKSKTYLSLSNKSIFKCMDIIEM